MSDQDPIVITEETEETPSETPEPSRFKKAYDKVAPYLPHLAITAVVLGAGALLVQAIDKLEDEEDEFVEGEVIVVEPETETD